MTSLESQQGKIKRSQSLGSTYHFCASQARPCVTNAQEAKWGREMQHGLLFRARPCVLFWGWVGGWVGWWVGGWVLVLFFQAGPDEVACLRKGFNSPTRLHPYLKTGYLMRFASWSISKRLGHHIRRVYLRSLWNPTEAVLEGLCLHSRRQHESQPRADGQVATCTGTCRSRQMNDKDSWAGPGKCNQFPMHMNSRTTQGRGGHACFA